MRPLCKLQALLALLLLLGAVQTDCKKSTRGRTRAQKAGRDPNFDEFGLERTRGGGRRVASDEQTNYLPDRGNKRVARELRCSICVATVHEVWDALPRRRADGRRPKQFEIEEALEDICVELERYGLQMENNLPTHRYSKNERIARHKGGWVEKFAVSVCSEFLGEHDEELVDLSLRDKAPDTDTQHHTAAVEAFCEQTMGLCLESERELLGDWDGDGKFAAGRFPTVPLPKDYL